MAGREETQGAGEVPGGWSRETKVAGKKIGRRGGYKGEILATIK